MMFPLVRDLAAQGVPVAVACEVLDFSRQAFYSWQRDPVCDRDWDDAHLLNAILDVHADDPEFGYRFITDELERAGHAASENRVHRLYREHRVWSTTTRKGRRGSGKTPGPAVHDDLVERDFTAAGLDEKWLADITEYPTGEGKLYLCAFKDVCSRRIVGYALTDRMTAELAVVALRTAIARRQPSGTLIVHSDRGSQGEFNRSSQHLDDGGVDGQAAGWMKETKTRSSRRTVDFGPVVAAALEEQYTASRYRADDCLVFSHPVLGTPLDPSKLTRTYLRPAITAAGIDRPGFQPWHGLRHSALTEAAAAGAPNAYVQARAGHSQFTITERYIHRERVSAPGVADAVEMRIFAPAGTKSGTR